MMLPALNAEGSLVVLPQDTVTITEAQTDSINITIESQEPLALNDSVKKVLFIGDSMTGWMAERFNAYGDINGFEVATVVWDGSTISKWANSNALSRLIADSNPDAVIISLGMNEMFESDPEKRFKQPVESLISQLDSIPYLWIGPPSWPGHKEGETFNDWMLKELGEDNYFSSFDLQLPRQSKSNPHPSRKGIEIWIDDVATWIPEGTKLKFPHLTVPGSGKVSRGKIFIYKRMKEKL